MQKPYEGVKPTTNRGDKTDYHGEPVKRTGTWDGERARSIPLTDTELEVLALGLGLIGLQSGVMARGTLIGPRTRKVAEALSIRLRAEISR